MNIDILLQPGIDDLIVTPELTTGVALLIVFVLIIPALGAIYLRSAITTIFVVFQWVALMLTILLGFNLSAFWVVSLITIIVLGISMSVYGSMGVTG